MTDWTARENQRLRGENHTLRQEYARQKATIAQMQLDKLLADERDRTDLAWLQGKVVRQARELQRLNDERNVDRLKSDQPLLEDVETEIATKIEVHRADMGEPVPPPRRPLSDPTRFG